MLCQVSSETQFMTIAHKNYLDSLSVPMKDSTSSDEENEDQPLAELSTPKKSAQKSSQVTCRDDDIGKLLGVLQQGKDLTDNAEKYCLLKDHFTPSGDFNFPRNKGRAFQGRWLRIYQPWLVFSPSLGGGMCIPRALFGRSYRCSTFGVLVRHSFN